MSILKRKRLYKDVNGQVWHVKSDGTAVKYPQFTVYTEMPKGVYEEILYKEHGIDVSDKLYLANQRFSYHLCVVSQYEEDFGNADDVFDVLSGEWVHLYGIDWILSDVANLICGHEYMIRGHKMTLVHFREEAQGFSFIDDKDWNCNSSAFIGVHQICCVKEIQKMPKEYKVWETENGERRILRV